MELYYKRTGIVKIYYQESDQLVRIILELLLQHDPEPDKRKVSVLKLKLRTTSIMVIYRVLFLTVPTQKFLSVSR